MKLATLGLLALACSTTALAHALLPLNAVANGGFEAAGAGWTLAGTGMIGAPLAYVSPGAEGTERAAAMPNAFAGYFLMQPMSPLAPGASVLDVSAKITSGAARPCNQQIIAIANWQPSGAGDITVRLGLGNNLIYLQVYGGAITTFPAASAGVFHHYQVVLAGAAGTGVLLVDGLPVGTASGNPASVTPANRLIVGDVAGYDNRGCGAAPDVVWDEIYYGP